MMRWWVLRGVGAMMSQVVMIVRARVRVMIRID